MIIKVCPQSGGVILIRSGFMLNCGLRVLSHGRRFMRPDRQTVEILYRIMCGPGWVSGAEVADWVSRQSETGDIGGLEFKRTIWVKVFNLRRNAAAKFQARLPIRQTRHGYEFCDEATPAWAEKRRKSAPRTIEAHA